MIDNSINQIIHKTVIESISKYAKKKIESRKRAFQILDLLIPKERKIRSIVGGLETSLGTTLWEPLAYELAAQNGFILHKTERLLMPENMPSNLARTIENILEARKNETDEYDSSTTHDEIRKVCQIFLKKPIGKFVNPPKGHGVDIWLEKDGIHHFFDIKTVQPNVGDFPRYLEQIVNWYAYFYSRWPSSNMKASIVFPYNPYNGGDFWKHSQNKGVPLVRDTEGLVENQFWDFCSGKVDTYKNITDTFVGISKSGELTSIFSKLFS